jgi:predicted RND superfamily exporter protein
MAERRSFVRFCEDLFFGYRGLYIVIFALVTGFLGWQASMVGMDANLEKTLPNEHPYMQNRLAHKKDLTLSNEIRVMVETTQGDIYTPEYLEVLRKITDEVSYIPGVDKARVQSLWTSNVRWTDITEDGFVGGEVIPADYAGTPEQIEAVRSNVLKASIVGRLVADNFKSTTVNIPLVDFDPASGEKHDYQLLSHTLEEKIRDKFQNEHIRIYITGFGKKVGDILDGATEVATFFFIAVIMTFALLWVDTRCLRSSLMIVFCSLVAVVWQLGILKLLDYGIGPYSMLIPFLIFAMAVSHSVQIVTSFAAAKVEGQDNLQSARIVFRSLFAPGAAALGADAIGFLTMYIIDIRVIQELAVAAGIGTAIVAFTNLILVKLLFSYFGISPKRIEMTRHSLSNHPKIWVFLSKMADPEIGFKSICIAIFMGAVAYWIAQDLKTGDLDAGAPELRENSRYNKDFCFLTSNYSMSPDIMVVMVETPKDKCTSYATMESIDRFSWYMENIDGVQVALSETVFAKKVLMGYNEGNPKWGELNKIPEILNNTVQNLPPDLININCDLVFVYLFLENHTDVLLTRVTDGVKQYAADNNDPEVTVFLLAAGSAGLEAAMNETIKEAARPMLWLVYGIVVLMCWMTFNFSVLATVCVITPLVLTSILCEAIMTMLGMGVKIGTLPVIALGVGIGVDYGIYIYSKMQEYLSKGMGVRDAYLETLCVTGKAVAFTGISLALGTGTWIFSEIKFQADMGLLLTFMFVWNMIGAMWLLPAIAELLIRLRDKRRATTAA